MLGGDFGDPKTAEQSRAKLRRSISAAMLLVASFFIEVRLNTVAGFALRAALPEPPAAVAHAAPGQARSRQ